MNVAGLVQLCQSSHPANYFHPLGIDSAVASAHTPCSPDQLSSMLISILQNSLAPTDGIAAGIAFRAARVGSLETLPALSHSLSRLPPSTRAASLQMGQHLWGISRRWPWALPVHQQVDPLTSSTDLHHALAFGTLASETTSSQLRAIATCLFNTARNIVLAACRAIPLPESAGQKVLSDLQPAITELAARCADRDVSEIIIPGLPE